MYFPSIYELATTDVKAVDVDATLSEAVSLMLHSEHRRIVVFKDRRFFAMDIYDVLRINRQNTNINSTLEHVELIALPTIDKDVNILEAFSVINYEHEHFAAINGDGSFYGLVAQSDIIASIDPDTLMDNYRLCDLIKTHKKNLIVDKNTCIDKVLVEMELGNSDAAIVLEGKKPLGIITGKDVLRLLKNSSDLSLCIDTYMSSPVDNIHHRSTINEALRFIKTKHYKRIVVVDDKGDFVDIIMQKELIILTYSRWVKMMKQHQDELYQINKLLEKKSQKFETIASIDALTGLYNRMKFIELFTFEYAVMTQRHNAMSLIIIDLDHFKQINDNYGHNVGDKVLKQISNLLLRELRNVDVLCRWGGEEFVALLPSATLEQTKKIANHIRENIASYKEFDIPNVTASFGLTQVKEDDTLESAINRADIALYEAKTSGRNSVKTN
jgi:diguanylate cyclase (GGDEF)-like protein